MDSHPARLTIRETTMKSEKQKLIRAYRQGVKDGAETVLLLIDRAAILDEIRKKVKLLECAETVDEMVEEPPAGTLVN
jgi:hypothetical protein